MSCTAKRILEFYCSWTLVGENEDPVPTRCDSCNITAPRLVGLTASFEIQENREEVSQKRKGLLPLDCTSVTPREGVVLLWQSQVSF